MRALINAIRHAVRALALVGLLTGVSRAIDAQVLASEMRFEIAPEINHPADLMAASRPALLIAEGDTLYDAGRFKEAAASFERAMQLGVARQHEAAWKVAQSYARLGNRKQARRWAAIAELLGKQEVDRILKHRDQSVVSGVRSRTI